MADAGTTPEEPVVMDGDVIVEFNEASSRQQINSGESVKTLFGKIRKFLTDLKAVAFSGAYSDLSGAPDLTKYALKSKYGDTTINVGRKAGTDVGARSTAEGYGNTANGNYSHAEGEFTTASGGYSHAEGIHTTASGEMSHAEGNETTASGANSHAEGSFTTASGNCSHAGGTGTKALHDNEVAYGRYNVSNADTVFSVGDGTSDSARHNAFEITKTGGKLHDKDIAVIDDIPSELPANGGNADTVDGVHISCTNDAVSGSNWLAAFTDTYNLRAIDPGRVYVGNAGNADTLDGIHASDFVRAFNGTEMNSNRIQIPNDVHVGNWLAANARVGMCYYINPDNKGLTGLPDGDVVWTWFVYNGVEYFAKTIDDRLFYMNYINSYSGWSEIYTSKSKPYVTGTLSEQASGTNVTMSFTIFNFTPSKVLCQFGSGNAFFANVVTNGFSVTIPAGTTTIHYIAFK